jgi:D-alanyl-D-alanine carboxypeptidase/D-alanyl-D-alanine-endopeptidase (penicillin-binding protein 4)
MILLGNSLAGYVEAKSGRPIVVVVAMGNMPFDSFPEFVAVTQDQAKMVELMQQAF